MDPAKINEPDLAFLPLFIVDFDLVFDEAGFLLVLVVFFLFADKVADPIAESLPSSRLRSIYTLLA
jgi:hypothetical protein